jgi:hypothetical protein
VAKKVKKYFPVFITSNPLYFNQLPNLTASSSGEFSEPKRNFAKEG